MDNNTSNVIIKVEDIDICRSFYSNAMKFGAPLINSNFEVEFRMGNDSYLTLIEDRKNANYLYGNPPLLTVNKTVEEVCKSLEQQGYDCEFISHADYPIYETHDPEGRPLMFTGQSDKSAIPMEKKYKTTRRLKRRKS
jgi:hypothetical protein